MHIDACLTRWVALFALEKSHKVAVARLEHARLGFREFDARVVYVIRQSDQVSPLELTQSDTLACRYLLRTQLLVRDEVLTYINRHEHVTCFCVSVSTQVFHTVVYDLILTPLSRSLEHAIQ